MGYVLELKSPKTGDSAIFIKLKEVYPECLHLISDEEQLHPLICLKSTCHRNFNCMSTLANRVKYIFDTFVNARLLFLYFSYRDFPNKQRAGIFTKELDEPRYITFNLHAWEKVKSLSTIYEWSLPDSVFLASSANLVQIGKKNG